MTATADRDVETAGAATTTGGGRPGALVVAGQECRDLWLSGRGPLLVFAFSVLLSVVTYLAATNKILNFLEQKEAVSLTLQVAVAVGVLMTLVVSADAISGERERGTLESLLLTPVSRRGIVLGKLTAALSLWFAAFVVTVPYVWSLGHGVSVVLEALVLGFVVGTLLAVALGSFGLVVSCLSGSNKVSLAISLFLLFALYAPTQLPTGAAQGWLGDLIVRLNPIGAGEHYISAVLVSGHGWRADLSYLASPVLFAVLGGGVLIAAGSRIVHLTEGVGGG